MKPALILLPGRTLGILGGGQLGRMTAREAKRAGYRVAVYTNEPHGSPGRPAGGPRNQRRLF